MSNIITRKCAKCKGVIEIDVDDIDNIIYFNKLYYHEDCFVAMAQQKAASKRGKPQMWQDALDDIWSLESETKRMLESYAAKDELNEWLLDNYDIIEVPKRLFQIISELEVGNYKGKRCKPVKASILCGCWKWGQRKLNEINQYNKSHNKGPTDDNARLMYDLTILVGKIPNYLAYKEKQKAAENEMATTVALNDDIDMSKIGQGKQVKRTDISDISDDIFVE